MIHDFTRSGWGNSIDNSGASWSVRGAVRSNDFMKIDGLYYKVIEAKPCGDPKDMSFVKSYMCIGESSDGSPLDEETLEQEYNKVKETNTIYEF